MDLTIRTSTGEQLVLHPAVPSDLIPIPGTIAWSFQDALGTIFIQEFHSGPYTVRFIFIQFVKKIALYWQEQIPLMRMRVATKSNWLMRPQEGGPFKLREKHSVLYDPGISPERLLFEKNSVYKCFDAQCTIEKLKRFAPFFPGLDDLLATIAHDPTQHMRWVSPDISDIILSIERCPFNDSLREYYLEHKLEELMLLLMENTLRKKPPLVKLPTDEERRAVYKVEQIIMADIMKHFPIRMLARMAGLNELRLKYVFKYVFGVGVFEYLLKARMRRAHELLKDTDKPMKEICSLTGYRSISSFINAFRDYYGYTPGSMRRGS